MASRFGRYGRVNRRDVAAYGICDRGGEVRKLRDLLPEMEWRGGVLAPNGFRVCSDHIDRPNPTLGGEQLIRPDPVPVLNPRPDPDAPPTYLVALLRQDLSVIDGQDGGPLFVRTTGPT